MSEPTRYRIDCFENFEEHKEGDLISYDDYEKITANLKIAIDYINATDCYCDMYCPRCNTLAKIKETTDE